MSDKTKEKNKDDKFPAKGAILPEQIAITAVKQVKFNPFTFIKQLIQQQNNAIQVNNGVTQPTETKKIDKLANELLSEVSHATLERGRSKERISADPEMAALEKIYRSEIT